MSKATTRTYCGRPRLPKTCTSWEPTRSSCGMARLWPSPSLARLRPRPEERVFQNRSKLTEQSTTMTTAPANPNKALWEKGDFTRIAETMRESGEALVQRLGITNGLKVLDLGCGDGTTALPAAKLGADVLGVDIAQNLVE